MDKNASFSVLGNATGVKTLTQFYNAESVKPAIVMNGGYFASNGATVSLLYRNNVMLAPNLQSMSRSDGTSKCGILSHSFSFWRNREWQI